MKKQILFIACIIVTIMLSIGAIYANDNVTDSYTTNSVDDTPDVSVPTSQAGSSQDSESNDGNANSNVDDTSKVSLSSKESLESENSNSLSTNILTSTQNSGEDLKKDTGAVASDNNAESKANTNIATIPASSTINSKDVTKYYKGSTKYTATFLNSQGQALANRDVSINVNGKSYTVKTDSNGLASLAINLKPGTYKVTTQNPDTGYSVTNTFKILTTITANNLVKLYKDSRKFSAKFLTSNGKALAKKIVKFKIGKKIYKVKTNKNGVASLSLTTLTKGTHKIISYNTDGLTKTNTIKVLTTVSTKITTKSYTYLKTNSKVIKATVSTSLGTTVGKGKTVTFKVNGKTYHTKTNKNGVATIKLGTLNKGLYTVKYNFYKYGNYKASSASNKLLILNNKNAAYKVKSSTTFIKGKTSYFKVALTASGIALSKRTVTVKVNNKTYVKTTNTNGIVSVPINLNEGSYKVKYSYNGEDKINAKTGSTTIQVKISTSHIVSVNDIINSAANLKNYYDTNKNLPATVSCGGNDYSIPEFLYLMTKATYQLGSSNMADITSIPGVSDPSSPSGDNINSENLVKAKYLTLAKNTASFIESKTRAPNYVSTSLGKITYEEIVDAMSRGLNFYKENNRLPNYLIISQGTTGSTGEGLNHVNSDVIISDYLKATKNCQVNDASIAKATASAISGLTTDYSKAKAIFEYVRDKLTYTFYLNTKYGAVNTLAYKKGNCVDHAHLIVAMCRNAGIVARYVHGYCTFTSGLQVGHVWAQVYINGKWYVADATSSRNSFGNIVNWNTKSYTFYNTYAELPF